MKLKMIIINIKPAYWSLWRGERWQWWQEADNIEEEASKFILLNEFHTTGLLLDPEVPASLEQWQEGMEDGQELQEVFLKSLTFTACLSLSKNQESVARVCSLLLWQKLTKFDSDCLVRFCGLLRSPRCWSQACRGGVLEARH